MPMMVASLEEMVDDHHAIVSESGERETYVGVMSFVNRDLLHLGCKVLVQNKVFHSAKMQI